MTTERKRYIKDEIIKASKYTIYGWSLFGLLSLVFYGLQSEYYERKYPTPPDWSLFSKVQYRNARNGENSNANAMGHVDYARVGEWYRMVIARLEDPSIDGAGLEPALKVEGDIYFNAIGKAGLDISSKPEPWCRGYHACLMGAARAAEQLDGWVMDKTRKISFPSNVIIGPSNPHPKLVPFGAEPAPLEENCVPAFGPPESFYTKILTTQGFNTRQRLDAALAYADWLDFKGLPESAQEMYDWGLDIAMSPLPREAQNVADKESGVIRDNAGYISSNVLLATTSLAIHHARNKNLSTALPIFLSVLRASRQLPPPSPALQQNTPPSSDDKNTSQDGGLLFTLKYFLITPPYPPAPSTGDEPHSRSPIAVCEEAGIMAHIGEIMFAASSASPHYLNPSPSASKMAASRQSQQAGINWTRDAVDIAEATLLSTPRHDGEARKKCAECIEVGLGNWGKMVSRMTRDAQQQQKNADNKTGISNAKEWDWSNLGWLWRGFAEIDIGSAKERWEREAQIMEERRGKLEKLIAEQGLGPEADGGDGWRWGLLFR